MDSPTQSSITPAASQSSAPESEPKREKEMLHRTKVIQFLGRTAPIILQNDNGPCPLLAICNVLSLKNNLNLSSDIPEISQEKLLSLVAERLIDSNIDINNKDSGYAENQQQNISDAIDLLPRLATGIDVNIKFRRIDDFEFTPECAIFDLLDIPLYHGWIVDPQDSETSDAIGVKSYNTLMGELVSLETQNSVDFVAATTAILGVPSPSLSRGQSVEDSPCSSRKGDIEEEAELLKALRLSEADMSGSSENVVVADLDSSEHTNVKRLDNSATNGTVENLTLICIDGKTVKTTDADTQSAVVVADLNSSEHANVKNSHDVMNLERLDNSATTETVGNLTLICHDGKTVKTTDADTQSTVVLSEEAICSFSKNDLRSAAQPMYEEGKLSDILDDSEVRIEGDIIQLQLIRNDNPASDHLLGQATCEEDFVKTLTANGDETRIDSIGCDAKGSTSSLDETVELDTSSQKQNSDKPEALSSGVDIREPIYEGEECILDSSAAVYETQEPIYEGEVVLAEQVDKGQIVESSNKSKDGISLKEGDIIRSFMKNTASQLTIYGLFCLQEKVKERELCVFFRNNHFNTMFKYEGELYILATDQGFINQPDLVWEKLNEVNGDILRRAECMTNPTAHGKGRMMWLVLQTILRTLRAPKQIQVLILICNWQWLFNNKSMMNSKSNKDSVIRSRPVAVAVQDLSQAHRFHGWVLSRLLLNRSLNRRRSAV